MPVLSKDEVSFPHLKHESAIVTYVYGTEFEKSCFLFLFTPKYP